MDFGTAKRDHADLTGAKPDDLAVLSQTARQNEGIRISLDIAFLKAQELWKDFEDSQLEREFQNLLSQAKKKFVSSQLERLEYEIKAAEKSQNKEVLVKLMADFSKISKELGN